MTVNELIHELEVLRDLEQLGDVQVEFLQRTDIISGMPCRTFGAVKKLHYLHYDGRGSRRIVLLNCDPKDAGYQE